MMTYDRPFTNFDETSHRIKRRRALAYVNHEAYQNYRRATAMSLRSSKIPSTVNIIKEITSTPN